MAVLAQPGLPGTSSMSLTDVDRKLRIEVKNQQSMYEATIIDIFQGVVTVRYDDGTFEEIFSTPGRLRNIPKAGSLSISPEYAKGHLSSGVSQVELKGVNAIRTCNFSTDDNATSTPLECWERRRYVAVASDHLLIVSDSAESSSGTMVVDLSTQGDCVRLPNSPDNPLAEEDWKIERLCYKFTHMDLQDTIKINKIKNGEEIFTLLSQQNSVNTDLQTRCGASQMNYNPVSKRLVAVYEGQPGIPEKIDLFKNAHTLMLSRIAARQIKINEVETLLNDEKSQARHTAELKIGMDLAKFGILDRYEDVYYHGKRVKEVREFEGVQAVYVMVYPQGNGQEDSLGFVILRVVAHSKPALDEAIGYLEFTEHEIEIPDRFGNRVVGNKGELIEDLIQKCGIIRVACRHELPVTEDGLRTFVLIGQKSKLSLAEDLIRYQINYLIEEEQLEAKMVDLNVEVAKARGQFIDAEANQDTDSGYKTTGYGYAVPEGEPPAEAVKAEDEKRERVKQAAEARERALEMGAQMARQPKQTEREQRQPRERNSPRGNKGNSNRNNNRRRQYNPAEGLSDTDTGLSEGLMSDGRPPSYAQLAKVQRSPRNRNQSYHEDEIKELKEPKQASAPRDQNNNFSAGDNRPQKALPQRQNNRRNNTAPQKV